MADEGALHYSDEECGQELDRLFPAGPGGDDVLHELAPAGWENSPLKAVFHPSVEQVFEEAMRIHEGLSTLRREDAPPAVAPTLDEIRATHVQTPVQPRRECIDLVTKCLWDIFSDNHEVRGPDGRLLDLGSFRGSGAFLADWLNRLSAESRYDYMDFYMGTWMLAGRADLSPVYELIFRRLRARGLDWVYHFPRLFLADLRGMREPRESAAEWESYDPSEAIAREQQESAHEEQVSRMRADLDEAHREAVERASHQPPPVTVGAYHGIYGRFPAGWPPDIEQG